MAIEIGGSIQIGGGINIGDNTSYSITFQSSDFTQGYAFNTQTIDYPIPLGTNGIDGFTVDLSNIPPDSTYLNYTANSPYNVQINNQTVADFFNGLVTAGLLSSASQSSLYSVTWETGSSITNGYAIMSGTSSSGGSLLIAPVDTAVTGWNTNPPTNNTTQELAGTFLFPATFTLVNPVVHKGGWC